MTRVSQHYGLELKQASLEFVDVPIDRDVKLYIDPQALELIDSDWARSCVAQIQSFFAEVLLAIQSQKDDRAVSLLAQLSEPAETRLGESRNSAKGSGISGGLATDIWNALKESKAATSGLLQDLEDSVLFVEDIGPDRISDLTTNVIRGQLAAFTQDACQYYGIDLVAGIETQQWSPQHQRFVPVTESLPMLPTGPLLMVPKSLVRAGRLGFDPQEYYTHWVAPFLQSAELAANSNLVEVLKNGRSRVTKKSVKEKYGTGKPANRDVTSEHPHILDAYRKASLRKQRPLSHQDFSDVTVVPQVDWDELLKAVTGTPTGKVAADQYHRAIQALLTALLYPALDFPKREFLVHGGRKRIDITYTNTAQEGFFHWMHSVHSTTCSMVMVECKNYGKDIGNPEFDQLTGRFGVNRGWLGILCHRQFYKKSEGRASTRDSAHDSRGYVILLDDNDLVHLVNLRKMNDLRAIDNFFIDQVHYMDS